MYLFGYLCVRLIVCVWACSFISPVGCFFLRLSGYDCVIVCLFVRLLVCLCLLVVCVCLRHCFFVLVLQCVCLCVLIVCLFGCVLVGMCLRLCLFAYLFVYV